MKRGQLRGGRPSRGTLNPIAVLIGLLAVGLTPPSASADADLCRELLSQLREQVESISTFHATAEMTLDLRIMSRRAEFGGTGRMWYEAPGLVRIETDRIRAEGVTGSGPPIIRIRRDDRSWMARIIEPSAPPIFQARRDTVGCVSCRQPGAPQEGFLRLPFPTLHRIDGLEPIDAAADSLDGRETFMLLLRVRQEGVDRGEKLRWWIDPGTHCLVREQWLDREGNPSWRYDFSQFEEVADGFWAPTQLRHYTPEGEEDFECRLSDIQIGVDFPPELFYPGEGRPETDG